MSMNKSLIKEKAGWFFNEKIAVHIKEMDGWCNGVIVSLMDNFLVLDEFKGGRMILDFERIVDIDKFTPKEEKKHGEKRDRVG